MADRKVIKRPERERHRRIQMRAGDCAEGRNEQRDFYARGECNAFMTERSVDVATMATPGPISTKVPVPIASAKITPDIKRSDCAVSHHQRPDTAAATGIPPARRNFAKSSGNSAAFYPCNSTLDVVRNSHEFNTGRILTEIDEPYPARRSASFGRPTLSVFTK